MTEHQITPSLAARIADHASESASIAVVNATLNLLATHQDPAVRHAADVVSTWVGRMQREHGSEPIKANAVERVDVRLKHYRPIQPDGHSSPIATVHSNTLGWELVMDATFAKTPGLSIEPPAEVLRHTNHTKAVSVQPGTVIKFGFHEIHLLAPEGDAP